MWYQSLIREIHSTRSFTSKIWEVFGWCDYILDKKLLTWFLGFLLEIKPKYSFGFWFWSFRCNRAWIWIFLSFSIVVSSIGNPSWFTLPDLASARFSSEPSWISARARSDTLPDPALCPIRLFQPDPVAARPEYPTRLKKPSPTREPVSIGNLFLPTFQKPFYREPCFSDTFRKACSV